MTLQWDGNTWYYKRVCKWVVGVIIYDKLVFTVSRRFDCGTARLHGAYLKHAQTRVAGGVKKRENVRGILEGFRKREIRPRSTHSEEQRGEKWACTSEKGGRHLRYQTPIATYA